VRTRASGTVLRFNRRAHAARDSEREAKAESPAQVMVSLPMRLPALKTAKAGTERCKVKAGSSNPYGR